MSEITKKIPYRWVVAFVLFFCYSIQYLDRVKSTVLSPSIMKDVGLTTSDIGTGAFLMMIFEQIPAQGYKSGDGNRGRGGMENQPVAFLLARAVLVEIARHLLDPSIRVVTSPDTLCYKRQVRRR